jgi:hypothetical protein
MWKRLFRRNRSPQHGHQHDVTGGLPLEELERESEGDPRGGLQAEEYRTAGPTDIVTVEGDVAMSGPAGAPQDDESPEERRRHDRS